MAAELEQTVLRLAQEHHRRFYGKYRGVVTENDDPDKQGRVRVKVAELFGDDVTGWAMPCVPFAPPNKGALYLPEVDSFVWVEFEGGDPSRPIWAGCFWWPRDKAPDVASPAVKI